jgi:hypothetical protein
LTKTDNANKTFEQKQDEKRASKKESWSLIKIIQENLMIYALIDFTLQIIAQMPIFPQSEILEPIGFRKVWDVTKEHKDEMTYSHMIKDGDEFLGYEINWKNFNLQCLNCFMICFISLQTEIFQSPGYKKFITQKSGSMDLIMSLADKKAKSLAYCFNNDKIRNIVSIQRRKETIMTTVEKLKDKLKRWRMFMRTTLTDDKKKLLKLTESRDSFALDKRESLVVETP